MKRKTRLVFDDPESMTGDDYICNSDWSQKMLF